MRSPGLPLPPLSQQQAAIQQQQQNSRTMGPKASAFTFSAKSIYGKSIDFGNIPKFFVAFDPATLAAAHSKVAMERQKGGSMTAGGGTTPPRRNSPVHFRKMTTPAGADSSHTMVEMATTMGSLDEELTQQRKRSISDVFEANMIQNIFRQIKLAKFNFRGQPVDSLWQVL